MLHCFVADPAPVGEGSRRDIACDDNPETPRLLGSSFQRAPLHPRRHGEGEHTDVGRGQYRSGFRVARTLLSSAIDIAPMLDPVHYDHLLFLENLVDDPIVAPAGHGQTFELAE